MDIIESIKRDKAYLKCKIIVKGWEKDFKTKNSRTPSKFDIKEAPDKIKYAYKKYFQLKSAALENSLSICDIDEEEPLGSPDPIQLLPSPTSDSSGPSDKFIPTLPTGQEIEKMLSSASQKHMTPLSPFTENLSKKLFHNRKFSMRNPRKLSLLAKSFSVPENDNIETQFSTPNELSKSKFNIQPINQNNYHNHNDTILKTTPVRVINEAWLNRAVGLTTPDPGVNKTVPQTSFGLTNIVIPQVKEKACDYIENSESETEDHSIDRLKPALKKRKIESHTKCNNEDESFEDSDTTKIKIKKGKRKSNITQKNNKVKEDTKTEDGPPNLDEYLPFGLEKRTQPRHSTINNVLNSIDVSTTTNIKQTIDVEENNKLETKIKNGTLNENFVKINIEKKVFVRGKKNISYSKYKKQQWKDKKALHAGMEFPEAGKMLCFKCGQGGHMARYCTAHRGDTLLPIEGVDENDIPTLEDMKSYVSKQTQKQSVTEELSMVVYEPSQVPESFLKLLSDIPCNTNLKPIYSNFEEIKSQEIYDILGQFGHQTFKPGQEEAIKRILCGMSTLLLLSTGGGKSLCYQLPAYLYSKHYKCITLVISPLVSLMEDQVLNMPEFLKAGCLHTNQPPTQRSKIIKCVKDGEINILLISPEALVSRDGSSGFAGLFKSLPQIAFACIDEVHCVSQWSHNFRPSYLMISRVLREKLNVKCILGLTATASQSTIKSIISHIDIPDGLRGVITNPALPENLHLSVSYENDKDKALLTYLTTEKITEFNSIVVYCIRRDECERVAAILRSCLQEPGKVNMEKKNNKRKRMSYIAEAYHAGMSGAQRKKIQKHFMDGSLRIIVATVAFGMGINKSDIRCIIHYNMPSSFESYVQEVGRAGRDGEAAYCHVFMSNSNNDKSELLKHIHSNTIDRPTIRKLLQKVFVPCECMNNQDNSNTSSDDQRCKGHEVGIPIDSTVEELDLQSENIATLLCYLELHPKKYIEVLNNAYTICKISSYGGPQKILEAAKTCSPLAMAYLIESKKDPNVTKSTILEFNVIEVAAGIGWESGITKYHLKNLEWISEGGSSRRSQLKVEFSTLGFRIKSPGDLSPTELDCMLDDLHTSVISQEKTMLYQLEESSRAFSKFGKIPVERIDFSHDFLKEKSTELKHTIRDYFLRDNICPENIELEERPLDSERVASDVRSLLSSYKDCTFTGRSIARIFQGISSPNFPAIVWGRCKFWRSHIHEDFYGIIKIATQQIFQMKM